MMYEEYDLFRYYDLVIHVNYYFARFPLLYCNLISTYCFRFQPALTPSESFNIYFKDKYK